MIRHLSTCLAGNEYKGFNFVSDIEVELEGVFVESIPIGKSSFEIKFTFKTQHLINKVFSFLELRCQSTKFLSSFTNFFQDTLLRPLNVEFLTQWAHPLSEICSRKVNAIQCLYEKVKEPSLKHKHNIEPFSLPEFLKATVSKVYSQLSDNLGFCVMKHLYRSVPFNETNRFAALGLKFLHIFCKLHIFISHSQNGK